MENWKQITDAPTDNYYISDLGRVKVIRKGSETIKTGFHQSNGYLAVVFGHSDRRNVHRLVGEYWCDRPEGTECLNHLDGNKQNNRADNLKWVTYAENNQHAFDTGLQNGFSENHWKSIPKKTVLRIYKLKKEGKRVGQIAEIIDLNYGTLKGIYSGKNWKYEYEKFFGEKYKKTGRGGKLSWNAIPEATVLKIYSMKKGGKRIFEIADALDLKFHTVKAIYHGINWKELYKQHFP